jgi:hypothetical protein
MVGVIRDGRVGRLTWPEVVFLAGLADGAIHIVDCGPDG